MKRALLCIALVLAGCADPEPHWACVDGFAYELRHGAWVRIDGHEYVGYRDGPLPCTGAP